MSHGHSKWYTDLAMVRERLDVRGRTMKETIEALTKLGLMSPVVEEMVLTVKVLGECANTVNNSIQEVSITLNEMGYELERAKKLSSGPVHALEKSTGTLKEFQSLAAIPEGWVHVQRVIGQEGTNFKPWKDNLVKRKKSKRKAKK